jgi:hypothetical protein
MFSIFFLASVLAAEPAKLDDYTPEAIVERIERAGEKYQRGGETKGYEDAKASVKCIRERVMRDSDKNRARVRAREVEKAFNGGEALPPFCTK